MFFYLSAAALQYLAPTILLLFCVLTLRTLGRFTLNSAQIKSDLSLVSIRPQLLPDCLNCLLPTYKRSAPSIKATTLFSSDVPSLGDQMSMF